MRIFCYIFLVVFLNGILGSIVLSSIDFWAKRGNELFEWYKSAPSEFFKFLVVELWFVVVFVYFYPRESKQ